MKMGNGKKRGIFKRILWLLALLLCLLFAAGAVAVAAVGVMIERNFQVQVPVELFRAAPIPVPPSFYVYRFSDRENRVGSGEKLTDGVPVQPEKSYVPYEEIPKAMIDAVVSIEDKRFYDHHGVDWYRTFAACVNYALGFSDRFGASTITQQLVKNITGEKEVSAHRKLQEILYARDLERNLDKREILELYLNVIPLSDGCNGISSAAKHYFSKEASELTVSECAALAAITNYPAYYNPIRHPENNLERRNLILSEMDAQGYLSASERDAALAEPLRLQVSGESANEEPVRSWYLDMVIEDVITDLVKEYGMSREAASLKVHSGGLTVDIAMDPDVQKLVEDYYRESIRTPVNKNGERAQSALIVLDPHTGDILGVAGAIGEKTANRVQNYATQTKRAPGSSLKPISVYAPALESGKITWSSIYDDVPVNFGSSGKQPWPKNAVGYYRGLTDVSYAVAHSINTVSVRILEDLELRNSFRWAKEKFHLESMVDGGGVTDCDVAALALGQLNYGVTLREITNAYTVFADAGVYHPCRSYYRVLDADGNILLSKPDRSEPVLSKENAAIMTKLMQGVIRDGTSSSVTLWKSCECAGKTGTSQNDHDRWFIGYTPDLICGVWCGFSYPEPIEGSNVCTGIWNTVMHGILQKKPGKTVFDLPSDVIRVSYCKDSGGLPDDACGFDPRGHRVATGWFVRGTEPTTYCDRHVLCTVDTVHGGVSHGFCPEEETAKRALIRVTRHFPMQIVVSDAQYVWRGEPSVIAPNPAESQAYFEASIPDFCGRSVTNTPFNRSCSAHTELQPPEEKYPQQGEALSTEPPGRSIPTPWDAERIPNKREEEIPPGSSPEEED